MLNDMLKKYGLQTSIPGSRPNDSQFAVFAHFLRERRGKALSAAVVRTNVAEWLKENSHIVLREGMFLTDLFSFELDMAQWEEYCETIKKEDTTGDIITLIGAAHLYDVNVFLISSSTMRSNVFWTEIRPGYIIDVFDRVPEEILMMSCVSETQYGTIVKSTL